MGKVIANAAMSLDGFVADTDDAVGPLFDWYSNGDVAITGADPERVFHVTEATAGPAGQPAGRHRRPGDPLALPREQVRGE
jgi:hypothetical protein